MNGKRIKKIIAGKSLRKPPAVILGGALLAVFIFITIFAHWLAPVDPWMRFQPYMPVSGAHWLGTNDIGNDIFSELIYGARVSLPVGFITALTASFIGLIVGLFAGYLRGAADGLLMGLTDIFLALPTLPLAIIAAAFLRPDTLVLSLLLGLLWWPESARLIRAKVLQVRETGFIQSAECIGFSKRFIVFSEILPNMIPLLIPRFMITFASAIIAEASISFLGLGDPLAKSWGMMINVAFMKGGFINRMWWWYSAPGICITLTAVAGVLLGMALEKRYGGIS